MFGKGDDMIFRKDIERYCYVCQHSRPLGDEEDKLLCPKKGIVMANYCCRHFDYDPFKRTPPKKVLLDTSRFSDEDFVL